MSGHTSCCLSERFNIVILLSWRSVHDGMTLVWSSLTHSFHFQLSLIHFKILLGMARLTKAKYLGRPLRQVSELEEEHESLSPPFSDPQEAPGESPTTQGLMRRWSLVSSPFFVYTLRDPRYQLPSFSFQEQSNTPEDSQTLLERWSLDRSAHFVDLEQENRHLSYASRAVGSEDPLLVCTSFA